MLFAHRELCEPLDSYKLNGSFFIRPDLKHYLSSTQLSSHNLWHQRPRMTASAIPNLDPIIQAQYLSDALAQVDDTSLPSVLVVRIGARVSKTGAETNWQLTMGGDREHPEWATVNRNTRPMRDAIAKQGFAMVLVRANKVSGKAAPGTAQYMNNDICGLWRVTECKRVALRERAAWLRQTRWADGSWSYKLRGDRIMPLSWNTDEVNAIFSTQPMTRSSMMLYREGDTTVPTSRQEFPKYARRQFREQLASLLTQTPIDLDLLEREHHNRRSAVPQVEPGFDQPPNRIFDNNVPTVDQIMQYIDAGIQFIGLRGQPQLGKNCYIQELEYKYIITYAGKPGSDGQPIQPAVILMSGLSCEEWQRSNVRDTYTATRSNVMHRPRAKGTISVPKSHILIIIDEAHHGTRPGGNISDFLKDMNLLPNRKDWMRERHICIVLVTATPSAILPALVSIPEHRRVVLTLEPPVGYYGFQQMLDSIKTDDPRDRRLYNSGSLTDKKVVRRMIMTLVLHNALPKENNSPKRFVLIRATGAHGDKARLNVEHAFTRLLGAANVAFVECNSTAETKDLIKLLGTAPTKHTIVFLKEFARCSIRLPKDHLAAVYEQRHSVVDFTAVEQGFAGRICNSQGHHHVIVFAPTEALRAYVKEMKTGLPDNHRDARIMYNNGSVRRVAPTLLTRCLTQKKRKELPSSCDKPAYPLAKRHLADLAPRRTNDHEDVEWLQSESVPVLRRTWNRRVHRSVRRLWDARVVVPISNPLVRLGQVLVDDRQGTVFGVPVLREWLSEDDQNDPEWQMNVDN